MDLHLHTPASSDYKNPEISYLNILQRAEVQGLDLIAFADHNTVSGYRQMQEEIEQLQLLEKLKRIHSDEKKRLKEYSRLIKKIKVLPAFEFTATFGFHVLGIFPEDKDLREIEHILLALNVPSDQLDQGSVTVGASADVLKAYEAITNAGGIAIAAHANSSNGVAMRGFAFGGQTKIAYTQDPNLHALEVTDLEKRGRYSTTSFFSGKKPEYPRRMHTIQGSDAHRLEGTIGTTNSLGVGDRVTQVLLPEPSFAALKDLFASNDFARTRPRKKKQDEQEFDFIRSAREEGSNIVQDFHQSMSARGGNLANVIADVCAFANTNGGTLFIGLTSDSNKSVAGVKIPSQAIRQLENEISKRISPPLHCTVDNHKWQGKNILRVLVPRGEESPYAVDDNKIYIRGEGETSLAVRDEIVSLISRTAMPRQATPATTATPTPSASNKPARTPRRGKRGAKDSQKGEGPPRTGVEVVSVEQRNDEAYYTVRDLRNGSVVKNVTEKSARKLWHYAITQFAELPKDIDKAKVTWTGDLGLLKQYTQFRNTRFDLLQRSNGGHRFYYGVTEDGVHGDWRKVVGNGE
jgi:PHP family Zn ribbon phosphoesterase